MPNENDLQTSSLCRHEQVSCLNPYELIRKYRCNMCGLVMMCDCDEAFGRRFLSHQLAEGTELKTRRRIKVTLGFQSKVCPECRGLPAEPAPIAEIYGHTTKIKRYYWREIFFDETRHCADWDEAHPGMSDADRKAAHQVIQKQVLQAIKAQHESAPKYVISEPSQADILKRYGVEVEKISAEYAVDPQRRALIKDGDKVISPEVFVASRYEAQGWTAMSLESTPFHALFGVMMWPLIQDVADPLVQAAGFGERSVYEAGETPPMLWTLLPEDFGSEGYGERRAIAIDEHFKKLAGDRRDLLACFDCWGGQSGGLRQYLWAHRVADVYRARRLIEILSPEHILSILRYLIEAYWDRYLGWPDIVLTRNEESLFIEVKSSNDKLSNDQKAWIAGNFNSLHLPFKIVKIHRSSRSQP